MPRIPTAKKVRLNLELSEDVRKRLEALRGRTEADSLAEVIRRALAVYDFLWTERKRGGKLVVRGSDDTEHTVVLI
jgi:hypothetical protein